MNKFQKLAQLNRDIELLEAAGKVKAAEVMHKKFIKEAQYPMPMAFNPFMVNPLMYSMMARPAVNPGVSAAQMPVVQPPTTPPTNTQTVSAPPTNTTPVPPATTSTAPTPVPASGQVNTTGIKPGTPPSSLTRSTNQQGNKGFMKDGRGNIYIFDENGNPKYVAPPGSTVGPGLTDINPGPGPTPAPSPAPSPGNTPPNERQNQLGNHFRNKIDKYFRTNPKPGVQDQYTFIGNLEDQLRQYRDSGNLTQQQYDDLSNYLYVR